MKIVFKTALKTSVLSMILLVLFSSCGRNPPRVWVTDEGAFVEIDVSPTSIKASGRFERYIRIYLDLSSENTIGVAQDISKMKAEQKYLDKYTEMEMWTPVDVSGTLKRIENGVVIELFGNGENKLVLYQGIVKNNRR